MFTPGSQLPQDAGEQIGKSLYNQMMQAALEREKLKQLQPLSEAYQNEMAAQYVKALPFAVGGGLMPIGSKALSGAALEMLAQNLPRQGGSIAGKVAMAEKAAADIPVIQRTQDAIAKKLMAGKGTAGTGVETGKWTTSAGKLQDASTLPSGKPIYQPGKEMLALPEVAGQSSRQIAGQQKLQEAAMGQGPSKVKFLQPGPIDPAVAEGDKFVKMMQRPIAQQGVQQTMDPGKLDQIRAYINANPGKSLISAAGGAAGVGAIPNLMVGGYSPQAQPTQPVGASGQQIQGDFAKGFTPGTASGIAGNLQKQQEQAVSGSAQQQGVSPQELLMRIAKAILMQGGGGASVDQIADLIYKSGALGQQDKYREAQIQEMGSREARTNAAIQMSRQTIEEKYNNAMLASRMNPKNEQLAEEARKAREERDAKLAEFDQRVYGAQQAGAQ